MSEDTATRLITVAIHTYEKAVALQSLLESEGIKVTLQNVNLNQPAVSPGVRVRILESDLPLALRIIENHEIFVPAVHKTDSNENNYILVPVDFSDDSLKIVAIAASIAKIHKASLTLLHSFIDPYVGGDGIQLTDVLTYDIIDSEDRRRIATDAKVLMDEFAERVRERMKKGEIDAVKFRTEVIEGVPEDVIASYAKSHPPILTVMSTRDADQKERELIGSVSAEVLDSARFPVMTVPRSVKSVSCVDVRQILFFCNADQDDILAMDTLLRLFPASKATVTLVGLPSRRRWITKTKPQSALDALTHYFRQNYPKFSFESLSTDTNHIIEDIKRLDEAHHFSHIVVPNKKRLNVISRLFHPSLTHQLIFKADIPMLVIPV